MFTSDQLIASQKESIDAFFGVGQMAFEGVERVVALNLQTTKAVLDEARDAVLGARDPKALLSAEAFQPAAEKATAYGRSLYEIASQTSAEINKVAEDNVVHARKQMLAFIDSALKNAPSGSENVANLFKTGVLAANQAFDGVQRLAKQATESVEANVTALAAKTTKTAPTKTRRG